MRGVKETSTIKMSVLFLSFEYEQWNMAMEYGIGSYRGNRSSTRIRMCIQLYTHLEKRAHIDSPDRQVHRTLQYGCPLCPIRLQVEEAECKDDADEGSDEESLLLFLSVEDPQRRHENRRSYGFQWLEEPIPFRKIIGRQRLVPVACNTVWVCIPTHPFSSLFP